MSRNVVTIIASSLPNIEKVRLAVVLRAFGLTLGVENLLLSAVSLLTRNQLTNPLDLDYRFGISHCLLTNKQQILSKCLSMILINVNEALSNVDMIIADTVRKISPR